MAEISAAERNTIEAVVDGVQRNARRRRQSSRTGWALLVTGGLSLPILAAALENSISLPTAISRIGIALAVAVFVSHMVGALMDNYQAQAAISTVENAVLTARLAVTDTPPAPNLEALTEESANEH